MSLNEINKFINSAPDNFNPKNYIPRLKLKYKNEIIKYMQEKYKYKNIHMIPKIEKITISASISTIKSNKEHIYKIYNSLYLMSGIKPIYTFASRSISQFRLHKGSVTGCKVILRNNNMYEFIERLICIYLPNIKGFRGIPFRSLNNNSLNIGIKDAHVVKEIVNYIKLIYFGFTVTIDVYSPNISSEQTSELLKQFDFPIRNDI